jgi:hypothetical protein
MIPKEEIMVINNTSRAGHLAAPREFFGKNDRYSVAPVHTRFSAVAWFVWDSERVDPLFGDRADVIRQKPTREEAVFGLV